MSGRRARLCWLVLFVGVFVAAAPVCHFYVKAHLRYRALSRLQRNGVLIRFASNSGRSSVQQWSISTQIEAIEIDGRKLACEGDLSWVDSAEHIEISNCSKSIPIMELISSTKNVKGLTISNCTIDGDDFMNIRKFRGLTRLRIAQSSVGDGYLVFREFPGLQVVSLSGPLVSNEYLAQIASKSNINTVSLIDTAVDSDGMASIGQVKHLTFLRLKSNAIQGNGLRHLTPLGSLAIVDLDGSDIDDDGVMAVRDMTSIRSLTLTGTRVTAEGVSKLKAAMPDCEVRSGVGSNPKLGSP
jgi:hypothetical protein